jgi:hypothetical protein
MAGAGPASAGTTSFATTADCAEHQAFVDGDAAAVAARLPRGYEPVVDSSSGQPLLFVRALRCKAFALGDTAPATMASFGIVVQSPDGRGCASGAPGFGSLAGDFPPLCNWYTLFWLSDDPRVVTWLRDGTPDFPAVYVPGLVFDLGAFDPAKGGAPFHFQAPAPAPSPFTIDEVGRNRPGALSVRGGYWANTSQGTVKLAFSTDDITTGDATGVVRAKPGSEMAELFGADERSYAAGYTQVSAEHWDHGTYRKQLIGAARPGETLDSFAGSCSVKGTNAFSPPVTDTQQELNLTYEGTGSCTGTLNGRGVSDAPVTVHDTGTSLGSCRQARTLSPTQGAITFADGSTILYTLDFNFALTEGSLEWYGQRSGFANGHGSFLTDRTPPDVVLKCGGAGNDSLPLDLSLTTESPLVSQRSANSPSAPAAPGQQTAVGRLRLAVRPLRVARGRAHTFHFRVFAPGRGGVAGALIRFAGHRARTGRRGRAEISTALHRRGRFVIRATKPGFRAARRSVLVR